MLPHWNWKEGQNVPVFVYTDYPTAELFVNGVSQGKISKDGNAVMEKIVKTAGKPHHIELETYRTSLAADGKDLAYVTASIVDKDGNLCPLDGKLTVIVQAGEIEGTVTLTLPVVH